MARSKRSKKKAGTKPPVKQFSREIPGIIILFIGIVFSFAMYSDINKNAIGLFGGTLKTAFIGLFSYPAYVLPVLVIMYGLLRLFDKNVPAANTQLLYAMVLCSLASAFIHAVLYWDAPDVYFSFDLFGDFFGSAAGLNNGRVFESGGIIGGVLATPLIKILGALGTIIVLIMLTILFVVMLSNVSVATLLRRLRSAGSDAAKTTAQAISSAAAAVSTSGTRAGNGANASEMTQQELADLMEQQNGTRTEKKEKPGKDRFKIIDFTARKGNVSPATESKNGNDEDVISLDFLANGRKNGDKKDDSVAKLLERAESDDDTADNIFDEPMDTSDRRNSTMQAANIKSDGALKDKKAATGAQSAVQGQGAADIIDIKSVTEHLDYKFPDISLLTENTYTKSKSNRVASMNESAKKLEDTLKSFGVEAKVINVSRGPVVTRFELSPSPGVKVSRIVSLADDIALNLAASGIRIEAPIPGKAAVGIEVPNKDVTPVLLREVIDSMEFRASASKLAFAIGKDISGEPVVGDIGKMPHVLIAGATGSGKSVCINALITSILYKAHPDEVKLLMIDPKVVELGIYNGIPHLLIPVVTDPRKAAGALNWAVQEMVNRYKLFAQKGARDIKGYNNMIKNSGEMGILPQIVIIIDELADLMMVASGEVEDAICRLAQMARAAGMHLVIATQRPSVDVITGVIKANIPSRIAFAVSSQVDSRTILDMAGAEKLLGKGDMLYAPIGEPKPIRLQGAFISDTDVEAVVEFVKAQGISKYDEDIVEEINNEGSGNAEEVSDRDALLPQAIEMVVETGQASVSLVQRRFKVGYARAGRIVDQMEERRIIGPADGSKPRQVLISRQQWFEMKMQEQNQSANRSQKSDGGNAHAAPTGTFAAEDETEG